MSDPLQGEIILETYKIKGKLCRSNLAEIIMNSKLRENRMYKFWNFSTMCTSQTCRPRKNVPSINDFTYPVSRKTQYPASRNIGENAYVRRIG
ncbi:unnamed protein product, partial [Trichogramma brassicae]